MQVIVKADANITGPEFAATCQNTHFASALRTLDPNGGYLGDLQYPNSSLPVGSPEYRSFKVLLDGPNTAGPVVVYPPHLECVPAMGSIFFPFLAGALNSSYDNFAYNGPFNPGIGWGMHFEGSVPLYADPERTIIDGRTSTAVSLRGVSSLLQRVSSSHE